MCLGLKEQHLRELRHYHSVKVPWGSMLLGAGKNERNEMPHVILTCSKSQQLES